MELNKQEIKEEIAQWLREDLICPKSEERVNFVIKMGKALLDKENLFFEFMTRLYTEISISGIRMIFKFIKNL
jgi:hypothetical protein